MISSRCAGARPRLGLLLAGAAGAAWMVAAPARAGFIFNPGVYELRDHPDALAAPPGYGLRLDELLNVTPGHDRFTFSFDHKDASMALELTEIGINAYSVRIFGTAYGGLDIGDGYDPNFEGLATIDFTYGLLMPVPGDDDIWVTTPTATNTGSITFLDMKIPLFDKANDEGYTFRLGNEDDDAGHRDFDGISGWGWLNHTVPDVHYASSDWLFTVIIPTPGTASLLAVAGLVACGPRRRRRSRAA